MIDAGLIIGKRLIQDYLDKLPQINNLFDAFWDQLYRKCQHSIDEVFQVYLVSEPMYDGPYLEMEIWGYNHAIICCRIYNNRFGLSHMQRSFGRKLIIKYNPNEAVEWIKTILEEGK